MSHLTNNKIIYILLIAGIMIFASSLYKRVITFDDAYFAEQAYWLNENGYARTELFNGILDWGNRQYTYHKLHVWQIAVAIKYFGWSPYIIKSIPMIYLLMFFVFAYYYFKNYISADDNIYFLIFLSLLLINAYVIQFSLEARPEIMIMCVSFISFYFIRQGTRTENIIYIIIAGALAGAAALFHLNGIVFTFSGIAIFLYMRNFKYAAIFTTAAAAIFSIYFIDIIANDSFKNGLVLLLNDPGVLQGSGLTNGALAKTLYSFKRYARHPYDFTYTLLLLLTIFINRKQIKQDYEIKLSLIYLITADVLLLIISPGGKSMYLVLSMPFSFIIISRYLYSNTSYRKLLISTVALYVITQTGHVINIMKSSNTELIQNYSIILNELDIDKTDKIAAPALIVFDSIGKTRVLACEAFRLLDSYGIIKYKSEDIFNYAKNHNVKYMILKTDFLPEFSSALLEPGKSYYGYKVIKQQFDYYIFLVET